MPDPGDRDQEPSEPETATPDAGAATFETKIDHSVVGAAASGAHAAAQANVNMQGATFHVGTMVVAGAASGTPALMPTPSYPDAETRLLSKKLADAQARKHRLQERGADTADVVSEILDLKRRLREGGQLRPGDSLGDGRYLLLNVLGRGGFATVWRAHDATRSETVAIKVLHSNLAGDPERLGRFRRGARVMNEIRHDAILRVREPYSEDLGWHYFVMTYMPEGDLRRAVLTGKIDWARAKDGILRICEALGQAHAQDVVHRDIKPANILLDRDGSLKLTDFDLVGAGDTTGGTRTGALGTIIYTAPEVMERPQGADSRADVFSLGMTVAFCVYGSDLPVTAIGHPATLIDSLPCDDALKVVLRKATAWEDKNFRYPDAVTFGNALEAAMGPSTTQIATRTGSAQESIETLATPTSGNGAHASKSSPQAFAGLRSGKSLDVSGSSATQNALPTESAAWHTLRYIRQSIDERGYPPTLREIGSYLGTRSTRTVTGILRDLEKKGFLIREPGKSRSLRPLDVVPPPGPEPLADKSEGIVEVPILGRIAAGLPLLAEEHGRGRLLGGRLGALLQTGTRFSAAGAALAGAACLAGAALRGALAVPRAPETASRAARRIIAVISAAKPRFESGCHVSVRRTEPTRRCRAAVAVPGRPAR